MIIRLIKETTSEELQSFDCGSEELNLFIKCFARQNDKKRIGRTFVGFLEETPVGFITLCSGSITFDELPKKEKLPHYPIPIIKIARFGIDKRFQRRGFGKEFLAFSFEKIAVVANLIGVKFVAVDAKDNSKSFYEHFGFVSLPTKPNTLVLPVDLILKAQQ